MEERVGAAWQRLEAAMAEMPEELAPRVRAGASAAAMARCEATTGLELPPALRASLAQHDGQEGGEGIAGGWRLLGCDEIAETWKAWAARLDGGELPAEADAEWPVRALWWSKGWIPVTADTAGTSHHCVDLDPDDGGAPGQVILVWADRAERLLVAASFAGILEDAADELSGELDLDTAPDAAEMDVLMALLAGRGGPRRESQDWEDALVGDGLAEEPGTDFVPPTADDDDDSNDEEDDSQLDGTGLAALLRALAEPEPEPAEDHDEARRFLELLLANEGLELEDGERIDPLLPGTAALLAVGGDPDKQAVRLSSWLLEQDVVAELYITDEDLGVLLSQW